MSVNRRAIISSCIIQLVKRQILSDTFYTLNFYIEMRLWKRLYSIVEKSDGEFFYDYLALLFNILIDKI